MNSSFIWDHVRKTCDNESFIQILSSAYDDFCFEIMSEYTLFEYNPHNQPFASLELFSREYAVQKHLAACLESSIRKILFVSVFESFLEQRGYDVFVPTEDDNLYSDDHSNYLSVKDFEDRYGFEFIIHDNGQLIGCRLTDIPLYKAEQYFSSKTISSIAVVDWYVVNGVDEKDNNERTFGNDAINVYGLYDFASMWLGEKESSAYKLFLEIVSRQYQDAIGIASLPKLTSSILFRLRLDEEQEIINTIKNIRIYREYEQRGNDTKFAYNIIDPNEIAKAYKSINLTTLEDDSKKLLSDTTLIDQITENDLYKVLVGKSDFAKSFLTSEYLFNQYNENDLFDYTAVVCGYLKSIEQLLAAVVYCFADKTYRIQSNGNKDGNGNYPQSSAKDNPFNRNRDNHWWIDLTSGNVDFIDTTFGSSITFIERYITQVLNSVDTKTFIDCLHAYRVECRNELFHTHNTYDWNRVKAIRHNTLVLYIMILGCFNFAGIDVCNKLSIITNDHLERAYYLLMQQAVYSFGVEINGKLYRANREAEREFPVFDDNGLLDNDFSIKLHCYDMESGQKHFDYLMTKDNVPDSVFTLNSYQDSLFE